MRPLLVIALAGCGRLDIDALVDAPARDAATDVQDGGPTALLDYGSDCALGMQLDELTWTGAPGEVIDACSHHNNGQAVRGAKRVQDALRGPVGDFPPTDGCVLVPDAPSLNITVQLTMSAWVYPAALDTVNPYGMIAKRTDYANPDDAAYTMFLWTGNTVWVDLDSTNDRNHGDTVLVNNVWQQVTVVYDGTLVPEKRVSIYVDGVLDKQLFESSASLPANPAEVAVGCLPELPSTTSQQSTTGLLDDVAIWARAMSPLQVMDWFNATK